MLLLLIHLLEQALLLPVCILDFRKRMSKPFQPFQNINYFLFPAFNYSGGYFNPVLATALKWGCSGHTNMEHVIVYWIGACVGAILSVPIFKVKYVHDLLVGAPSSDSIKDKTE